MVRHLLAATSDAAVLLDENGVALMANRTLADMLGVKLETLKNTCVFDYMSPMAAEFRRSILKNTLRIGDHREYDDLCTPGKVFNTRIFPFTDEEQSYSLALIFFTDITARQKAEKERIRLASAIEQAAEAMIIMDCDLTIEYVNQAFESMTGYAGYQVRGKNVDMLYCGKEQERQLAAILATIRQGEPWTGLCSNTTRDGRSFQTEKMVSPIRGQHGVTLGYVSVWRDMTQISELERQLREAQKMEAMGTLAGGIAHDFNNILSPIILHAELGMDTLSDDHPARHAFTQIITASRRAADLVQQILNLNRRKKGKVMPFSLSSLVKECFKLLRPGIPSTIELTFRKETETDTILADPAQVHQVIVNLCTNAVQAMTRGGVLSLRVESVTLTASDRKGFLTTAPGEYVLLTVHDTGEGMTDEVLERIYDPFFTTKHGKGSGLGLTVVHSIVTELYGAVRAESVVGQGTVFYIIIPVHRQDEDAISPQNTLSLEPGRGRVLVVDDEKSVRESCRLALSGLGYEVLTCGSGKKALALLERNPNAIDVVLTDVTMPGMTGLELTRKIRALRPEMPVILCSGYNDELSPGKLKRIGARDFIGKPFSRHDLSSRIAAALRSRNGKNGEG